MDTTLIIDPTTANPTEKIENGHITAENQQILDHLKKGHLLLTCVSTLNYTRHIKPVADAWLTDGTNIWHYKTIIDIENGHKLDSQTTQTLLSTTYQLTDQNLAAAKQQLLNHLELTN